MTCLKIALLSLGTTGLIFLGACSSGNQTESATSSPVVSEETAAQPGSEPNQGGQVIESGPYHLEFVSAPANDGTHLDFYLQRGDTHEPIPNAKVTAQVQTPSGQQQALDMTYDSDGKHYTAMLPEQTPGQYQVAVLSEIDGKKVNGRFNFQQ
jgi:hypothetical protein